MHKNCCHQSCSFWLRYAPNRLSAGALLQTSIGGACSAPQTPSWFSGWDPRGKGRREGGGKAGGRTGKGGKENGGLGFPECPNPELASTNAKNVTFYVFALLRTFLPRDAMHKCGICWHAVSVCLSVRLSRSWVAPKQIKISSKFFHRRVAKPF